MRRTLALSLGLVALLSATATAQDPPAVHIHNHAPVTVNVRFLAGGDVHHATLPTAGSLVIHDIDRDGCVRIHPQGVKPQAEDCAPYGLVRLDCQGLVCSVLHSHSSDRYELVVQRLPHHR